MASTEPAANPCLRTGECLAKASAPARVAAENGGPAPIRRLVAVDVPDALRLSASAHWNQNEADWRTMLTLGQGWGIPADGPDGREQLAASVVVLPYAADFAWVSMVLVLPEFQRRGYARQLLRHALGVISARGMAGVLDATPAGHAVYLQEGFRDGWGFARYRRTAGAPIHDRPPGPPTRALREIDWPAIEAMDRPAFGGSRLPLLQSLAQRLPRAARVLEVAGRLRGFVLGRDGREASQIGPLLAEDDATATSLLVDVLHELPGPVYVDLVDHRRALLPGLAERGFVFQRPFTRMVHGASQPPGANGQIVLVAGPELG